MAQLPQVANSENNNEGQGDRSIIQPGDYVVCITKSEFKATKAKTGHYLNLTLVIAEGQRKGSMMWTLLNLDNPNPVAVEMANKELNSICQACGLVSVEDSDELHGIPFGVTIDIKPGDASYPPSNTIKNYMPADDVDLGSSGGAEAESPKQTTATGNTGDTTGAAKAGQKLPWEK